MQKKGFTLIELLIVVGILAVLATVVVLVLNPAELFKQARDARRVEDLSSIRGALNLYLATVSSPDLDGGTSTCTTLCYAQTSGIAANCGGRHGTKTSTIDTTREVDSNGWIPVAFTGVTGGSPLGTLPIDPTNSTTYFYTYACDNSALTFEIDANMESSRYAASGSDDVETTDGGSMNSGATAVYETGNDPGLDL